ncbi:putative protein YviE [Neobacillus rhizosphaerae]|uniref:WIAG-tail domain n=1 Tax=Neobacillus rhizosphaerae TaxID=2880965 RepID=A0ABN8KMB7_9BACI|nr:DUF6470 family protein [Neobacillus rhizosphaerae]CAH2712903.1 putative protein YviE [Neobacillus rhizosphaerae]
MQLPQIRMHQTYAQIGLRTVEPVQEIQQIPADLSIKQYPSQMNIVRNPSQLEIDQEQAWNELNCKKISVLSADMAEFSKQEGLEAIAQISQEGDQLARIEQKNDAIVSIATEKGNPEPADFNIAFIPSYGSVKIHYTPTELFISWKQGGAEIEFTPHKPILNYTPGKTKVYLRQMQDLQIDFVGLNVNKKL